MLDQDQFDKVAKIAQEAAERAKPAVPQQPSMYVQADHGSAAVNGNNNNVHVQTTDTLGHIITSGRPWLLRFLIAWVAFALVGTLLRASQVYAMTGSWAAMNAWVNAHDPYMGLKLVAAATLQAALLIFGWYAITRHNKSRPRPGA